MFKSLDDLNICLNKAINGELFQKYYYLQKSRPQNKFKK